MERPNGEGKWLGVKQQLSDELESVSALERERAGFAPILVHEHA